MFIYIYICTCKYIFIHIYIYLAQERPPHPQQFEQQAPCSSAMTPPLLSDSNLIKHIQKIIHYSNKHVPIREANYILKRPDSTRLNSDKYKVYLGKKILHYSRIDWNESEQQAA